MDWEERIDFGRLRQERLQKAKDALANSDVDALFVFRTEDCRYLISFRSHLHPTASLGMAVCVLVDGGEPYVLDSLGHGSGTNPWELPYFSPATYDEPMALVAGMTFNLEPYAGKPGVGGFRLENNVVVTENGPDVYTPFPYDERLVTDVHELDTTTGRTR